jgi:hypothetical protein
MNNKNNNNPPLQQEQQLARWWMTPSTAEFRKANFYLDHHLINHANGSDWPIRYYNRGHSVIDFVCIEAGVATTFFIPRIRVDKSRTLWDREAIHKHQRIRVFFSQKESEEEEEEETK